MSSINNMAKFSLPCVLIIGVIMVSFFLGCDKVNKLADITKDGDVRNVSIPRIDMAIPTKTETATFSLG